MREVGRDFEKGRKFLPQLLLSADTVSRAFDAIREYLERLEKRTPIWTIYDGTGGDLPLAERLNEKQTLVR